MRPVSSLVVTVIIFVGATAVAQESVEVQPMLPLDDAVVQARPLFHLNYTGLDDDRLRKARFRITLDSQMDDGGSISFDQRKNRNGWAAGEAGEMIYRPKRPLPDGDYRWEVAFWDGTNWRTGDRRFRLRVDSVPPASVENLTVRRDPERGVVELEWDPVAVDVEGGAEYVARYHVYRYPRADRTPAVEPFEVAETDQTRVTIPADTDLDTKLWFYRVSAEDLAGNEAGRAE